MQVTSLMPNTASLQDLAALCATADEVTSLDVHLLSGSAYLLQADKRGTERRKGGALPSPGGWLFSPESSGPPCQDGILSAEVASNNEGRGSPARSRGSCGDLSTVPQGKETTASGAARASGF